MKKILITGGILAVLAFAFKDKIFGTGTEFGDIVTYPNAPNGGVWVITGGKKYGFNSEAALGSYFFSNKVEYYTPKIVDPSIVVNTPDGGWVSDDGIIQHTA